MADGGLQHQHPGGNASHIGSASNNFTSFVITLGPEETVFDWTVDRCEDLDVPDVAARAIRRKGEIVLISGNAPAYYFSYGLGFDRLKRFCTPVLILPTAGALDRFATCGGSPTTSLSRPSTWRIWDGQGFNIAPSNQYTNSGAPACAFLSPTELAGLRGSLTYNTYLERYMLVGTGAAKDDDGTVICGIFYSVSRDLISWSKRQLLKPGQLPW